MMELFPQPEVNCIFCEVPFVKEKTENNSQIFKIWSNHCAESISCLFKIPRAHPIRQMLKNGNFCPACHQIVREVDFTIRNFSRLLTKVEKLQKDILQKVATKENGDIVKTFRQASAEINEGIEQFKNLMGLKHLDSSLTKVEIDSETEEKNCFYEPSSPSKDRNKRRRLLRTQKSGKEEDDFDFDPGVSVFYCDVAEEGDDDEDYEVNRPAKKRQKEKRSTEIAKPFKCSQCSTRYSCLLTFNAHKRKVHKRDPLPYHCDQCPKKLRQLKSLRIHKVKNCPGQSTRVEVEGELLNSSVSRDGSSDEEVAKTQSDNKTIPCPLCPIRFSSLLAMEGHRRRIHEGDPFPYQCSSCHKKFKLLKSLRLHPCQSGDGVPPPKTLACPHCLKKFSSAFSLERHTAALHPLHSCTFCSLTFPSREETVTHELLHRNSDQPFTCTICPAGAAFPNSGRLKEHVAAAHLNKVSICDSCGLKFKSVTGLKKHQKLHDASFVGFRCAVCGATFVTKSTLATHMLKHGAEKGFTCEICGKGFIHPASLKRHRISHEERLPIECKICGKKFATRQFLVVHEETHSGTLSYECGVCGKKFQTRQGRRQHVVGVHGRKDANRRRGRKRNKIKLRDDDIQENESDEEEEDEFL